MAIANVRFFFVGFVEIRLGFRIKFVYFLGEPKIDKDLKDVISNKLVIVPLLDIIPFLYLINGEILQGWEVGVFEVSFLVGFLGTITGNVLDVFIHQLGY